MVSDPDSDAQADSLSLGRQLAAARERRGWSVGEVANLLRIRLQLVEALEGDDHAAFGAATYARGQLRNYAQLVGVEIAKEPYRAPPVSVPGTLSRRAPELHPRRPRLVRWGGLGIVVVLVALGALWARDGRAPEPREEAPASPAASEGTPTPQTIEIPAASEPAAPAAASAAPEVATLPTTVTATPTEPAPSGAASTEQPTTPPAAVTADGAADIRIRSRAVSWVEVTDHTGRRLVYELVSPGPERAAQGVPPLRVLLGNAPAVELLYNGAPVTLPAGQHVVRLTLGEPTSPAALRAPTP